MSNFEESISILNHQLEDILADETDELLKFVRNYMQRSFIWKCVKFFIFVGLFYALAYLLVYYIPLLSWNASAIGRIALINLILPAYNWQYLYGSRCLMEISSEKWIENGSDQLGTFDKFGDHYCNVCENLGNIARKIFPFIKCFYFHKLIYFSILDTIDRISNTSFGNLYSIYLIRDHPVIVTDSHKVDFIPANFVEYLQTLPQLRHSIPCNIVTNLLQIRNEYPNLKHLFEQIKTIGMKEWFLHFRNCEFQAVKESRGIFPHKYRPYYMSNHLPPFHSSWILISNQHNLFNEIHLPVKDFVFVFQLRGKLIGRLLVQKKCEFLCASHDFQLNAGEALIFNAEMWDFYYNKNISEPHSKSLEITFIQEIRVD